jgi:hypothetical protein
MAMPLVRRATASAPAKSRSAQITRFAPRPAKLSAIAAPIPLAAPVITMILSLMSTGFSLE